jgi:hypothetical protein
VAVVLFVVQGIVNYFIAPNIMRVTVRMHPVTVMISLIAGATLAGFWGMLLAVPIVASIKVVVAHFWLTRVPWGEEVFWEGDHMESIPHTILPEHEAEHEEFALGEGTADAPPEAAAQEVEPEQPPRP